MKHLYPLAGVSGLKYRSNSVTPNLPANLSDALKRIAKTLFMLLFGVVPLFSQCPSFNFQASDSTSDAYISLDWSIPQSAYQDAVDQNSDLYLQIMDLANNQQIYFEIIDDTSFFNSGVYASNHDLLLGPSESGNYQINLFVVGLGLPVCNSLSDAGYTDAFKQPVITASSDKPDKIVIGMTNTSDLLSYYNIYRDNILIGQALASETVYEDVFNINNDSSIVNGGSYTYCIEIYNTELNMAYDTVCDMGSTKPINLSASDLAFPSCVVLTWNDMTPLANTFKIYRDDQFLAQVMGTSFTDTDPTFGKVHEYSVYLQDGTTDIVADFDEGGVAANGHISGFVYTSDGSYALANLTVEALAVIESDTFQTTTVTDLNGHYAFDGLYYKRNATFRVNVLDETRDFVENPKTVVLKHSASQALLVNFEDSTGYAVDTTISLSLSNFILAPIPGQDRLDAGISYNTNGNLTWFQLFRDNTLIALDNNNTGSLPLSDLSGVPGQSYLYRLNVYYMDTSNIIISNALEAISIFPEVAPVPGAGFQAVANPTNGTAVLNWSHSSSNFSGFNIYRDGQLITAVDQYTTTYEDYEGQPNTPTTYSIAAVRTVDGIDYESAYTVATPLLYPALPAPSLQAVTSNLLPNYLQTDWTFAQPNSYNYTGFAIIRRLAGGTFAPIAWIEKGFSLSHEDETVIPNDTYDYAISTYNLDDGIITYSPISNIISGTADAVADPIGFQASDGTMEAGVVLFWGCPQLVNVVGADISFQIEKDGAFLATTQSTTYTDYINLPANAPNTYTYSVTAVLTRNGNTYFSNTISDVGSRKAFTPNNTLPVSNLSASTAFKDHVAIAWNYPNYITVNTFELYRNGIHVASLPYDTRSYYDADVNVIPGMEQVYQVRSLIDTSLYGSSYGLSQIRSTVGKKRSVKRIAGMVSTIVGQIGVAGVEVTAYETGFGGKLLEVQTFTDANGFYAFDDVEVLPGALVHVEANLLNHTFTQSIKTISINNTIENYTVNFDDTYIIPQTSGDSIASPINLIVTPNPTNNTVELSWGASNSNYSGFYVNRGIGVIEDVPVGQIKFAVDTGGFPGTEYTYGITAYWVQEDSTVILSEPIITDAIYPAIEQLASVTVVPVISNNHVRINWSHPSGNVDGYAVLRQNELLDTVAASQFAQVLDTTGLPGQTYEYTVVSYTNTPFGISESAPVSKLETYPNVTKPMNLFVDTPSVNNNVTLKWELNANYFTGFSIQRNGQNVGEVLKNESGTYVFKDYEGLPGSSYNYIIKTYKEVDGIPYYSLGVAKQAMFPQVEAPESLTLTADTAQGAVRLDWVYPDTNGIDGYILTRDGKGIETSNDRSQMTFLDKEGFPEQTYVYAVYAFSYKNGINDTSNSISGSITFPSLQPVTNFQASDGAFTARIELTWNYPTNNIDSFEIWKKVPLDSSYSHFKTVSGNLRAENDLFDNVLTDAGTVNYRIRALKNIERECLPCTPTVCVPVQQQLREGISPKTIYDNGMPLDSLYGKTYQGGLIFYLNTTTGDGMVAASFDQAFPIAWINNGNYAITGATGQGVGSGQANTNTIVSIYGQGNYAAGICDALTLGGYSDWFLPSTGELQLAFSNLNSKGFGNFSEGFYWSSTELDSLNKYCYSFDPNYNVGIDWYFGDQGFYVRAARSFSQEPDNCDPQYDPYVSEFVSDSGYRELPASIGSPQQILYCSNTNGGPIAADEDWLVVGLPDIERVQIWEKSGNSYVFDQYLNGGIWDQPGTEFGDAVDIDKSRIIVGAPNWDYNGVLGYRGGFIMNFHYAGQNWVMRNFIHGDDGNQREWGVEVGISGGSIMHSGYSTGNGFTSEYLNIPTHRIDVNANWVWNYQQGNKFLFTNEIASFYDERQTYSMALDSGRIVAASLVDDANGNLNKSVVKFYEIDNSVNPPVNILTGTFNHTLSAGFNKSAVDVAIDDSTAVVRYEEDDRLRLFRLNNTNQWEEEGTITVPIGIGTQDPKVAIKDDFIVLGQQDGSPPVGKVYVYYQGVQMDIIEGVEPAFGSNVAIANDQLFVEGKIGITHVVYVYPLLPPQLQVNTVDASDGIGNDVVINWEYNGTVDDYNIYRDGTLLSSASVNINGKQAIDQNAVPGRKYVYEVTVLDAGKESVPVGDVGFAAADGVISGNVLTAIDGQGVADVSVTAEAYIDGEWYTYNATTNAQGNFAMNNVYYGDVEGIYTMSAAYSDAAGSHDIRPLDSTKTLKPGNGLNSVFDAIFIDYTAYSIAGTVRHNSTGCGMEGIKVILETILNNYNDTLREDTKTDGNGYYSFVVNPRLTGLNEFNLVLNNRQLADQGAGPDTILHDFDLNRVVLSDIQNFKSLEIRDFADNLTYPVNIVVQSACGPLVGDEYIINVSSIDGCFDQTLTTSAASGSVVFDLPPLEYIVVVQDVVNLTQNNTAIRDFLRVRPQTLDLYNLHKNNWETLDSNQISMLATTSLTYHKAPTIAISTQLNYLCNDPLQGAVMTQDDSWGLTLAATESHSGSVCHVNEGYLRIINNASIDNQPFNLYYDTATQSFPLYMFTVGEPNMISPHKKSFTIQYFSAIDEFLGQEVLDVIVLGSKSPPGNDVIVEPGDGTVQMPLYILRDPMGDLSFSSLKNQTTINKKASFSLEGGLTKTKFSEGTFLLSSVGAFWNANLTKGQSTTTRQEFNLSVTTSTEIKTSNDGDFIGEGADIIMGSGVAMQYGIINTLSLDENDPCLPVKSTSIGFSPNSITTSWVYTVDFIESLVSEFTDQIHGIQDGSFELLNPDGSVRDSSASIAYLNSLIDNWENVLEYHRVESLPHYILCDKRPDGEYKLEFLRRISDQFREKFNLPFVGPIYENQQGNLVSSEAVQYVQDYINIATNTLDDFCPLVTQDDPNGGITLISDPVLTDKPLTWTSDILEKYNQVSNFMVALENGFIQLREPSFSNSIENFFGFPAYDPSDNSIIYDAAYNLAFAADAENFTIAGGTNLTKSVAVGKTKTDAIEQSNFLDVSLSFGKKKESKISAGLSVIKRITNISAQAGKKFEFRIDFSQEATTSINTEVTTAYTISDDDQGDQVSVTVVRGPAQNHTPYFQLFGGRSSCPYEEGTIARDVPVTNLVDGLGNTAPNEQFNVPHDQLALFPLQLANGNPFQEDRDYEVFIEPTSNPNGAVVRVNGVQLGTQLMGAIPVNNPVNTILTIERGPAAYQYDSLQIGMRPSCTNAAGFVTVEGTTTDYQYITVHFVEPCTELSITDPSPNWVMNKANQELTITMTDYDLNNGVLENVALESRRIGSQTWDSIAYWTKSDLVDTFNTYILANPIHSLFWNINGNNNYPDGDYELRATATCGGSGSNISNIVSGHIDRTPPAVFGKPQPSDRVLSIADDIAVNFTETIDCPLFDAAHFTVTRVSDNFSIPGTVACYGNQMIFSLANPLSDYEGDSLVASVHSVVDLYGNMMEDTAVWGFNVIGVPLPALSKVEDVTVCAGAANAGSIYFEVFDADDSLALVQTTVTSLNTSLLPNSNIYTSGFGSTRLINIVLPVGLSGMIPLQVIASDPDDGSDTAHFNLMIYPDDMSVDAEVVYASVPGASDGAIDVTMYGGVGPYTYQWSNGNTSEDLSGLSPGMYRLTVNDVTSCFERVDSFLLQFDCGAPQNVFTDNIDHLTARLNWDVVPYADHYVIRGGLKGSSAANSVSIVINNSNQNYYETPVLKSNTSYDWQVMAYCDADEVNGSEWSNLQNFTTFGCAVPQTTKTTNIHQTGATYVWNPIPGVAGYVVRSRVLPATNWTTNIVTGAFQYQDVVPANATVEWQVQAHCSSNGQLPSAWSDVNVYTTTYCGAPGPGHASGIDTDRAILNWSLVNGAEKMELRYRRVGQVTPITITVNKPEASAYQLSGLLPGTEYEWQMRTVCNGGATTSQWTTINRFVTLQAQAKMESAVPEDEQGIQHAGMALNVYPNPTRDVIHVTIDGATEGMAHYTLVNLLGETVYEHSSNVLPASSTHQINLARNAAGVYLLTVRQGSEVQTVKVIKGSQQGN